MSSLLNPHFSAPKQNTYFENNQNSIISDSLLRVVPYNLKPLFFKSDIALKVFYNYLVYPFLTSLSVLLKVLTVFILLIKFASKTPAASHVLNIADRLCGLLTSSKTVKF